MNSKALPKAESESNHSNDTDAEHALTHNI